MDVDLRTVQIVGALTKQQTMFRNASPDSGFTILSNRLMQCDGLSPDIRGFIGGLLTFPADWTFNFEWAERHFGIGETKLKRLVRESKLAGFMKVEREKDASGKYTGKTIYLFTDVPNVFVQDESSISGKTPPTESSISGKTPHTEPSISGKTHRVENPTGGETPPHTKKERKKEINNYTGHACASETFDCFTEETNPDYDSLERLLSSAGGEALADPASSPGLIVLAEPYRWLSSGCDLEKDILPTIKARCVGRQPRTVRSWTFFTQAIADARAQRLAPMPNGNSQQSFKDESRADRIQAALENLRRGQIERGEING